MGLRRIFTLASAFMLALWTAAPPALAQSQSLQAAVVGTCGTAVYVAGQVRAVTQDTTGTLCAESGGGGGSNPAAGATGSAPPADASYNGLNVGGTLRGQTGVNPTGTVYAGQTDLTSAAGTTLSVNAGAVGAGSPRVAVGQDTTTIAGSAPGTSGTPSANVITVQGPTSGGTPIPANVSPGARTIVALDISTVTTGGTAVTALNSGHRTAGGFLQNPVGATINLCINEQGTASGTTSAGATTCILPGQSYSIVPAAGAVSVITSDSSHPFSGYGLN